MDTAAQKKFGPLIGIGLMFLWGSAVMFFTSLANSTFSFLGAALASGCGLGAFLYVGRLEGEIHRLLASNAQQKAAADKTGSRAPSL
jgi:hypothetical protein